jgi:hypothetical protein
MPGALLEEVACVRLVVGVRFCRCQVVVLPLSIESAA